MFKVIYLLSVSSRAVHTLLGEEHEALLYLKGLYCSKPTPASPSQSMCFFFQEAISDRIAPNIPNLGALIKSWVYASHGSYNTELNFPYYLCTSLSVQFCKLKFFPKDTLSRHGRLPTQYPLTQSTLSTQTSFI